MTFKSPACGDSIRTTRIEIDGVCVPPGLAWGKGEKGWCDLVCVERLYLIGLMVVLMP